MTEETRQNYIKFRHYLKSYITRDGIDKLIKFLDEQTDLAVAPASGKFHASYEGGLVQHSLNVFNRMIKQMEAQYSDMSKCPYNKETIALVSLLHDISKVNVYALSMKNVKNEDGNWVQVPYYSIREDGLLYGTHEENSIFILENFIKLTYEEKLAILYHSGGMNADSEKSIARTMKAFTCPLVVLLHVSDLLATSLDESYHSALSDASKYSLREE